MALVMVVAAATAVGVPSPAQAALSVQAEVVTGINATTPSAHVRLRSPSLAGDYELTWSLEKFDRPVAGWDGSGEGTLDASGNTAPFAVAGAGLREGHYEIVGTLEVTPVDGAPQVGSFSVPLLIDRVAPDVTVSRDRPLIYPRLPYDHGYPKSVRVAASGTDADEPGLALAVRRADGSTGAVIPFQDGGVASWDGWLGNAPAPPGTYTLVAVDQAGNASPQQVTVDVSGKRFVLRTVERRVTATSSLLGSGVGRCSTLRRPAARGWKGSLGLYSNTRCSASTNAGRVWTNHGTRLPKAAYLITLRVHVFGGAAASRTLSWARLRAFRADGTIQRLSFIASENVGLHKRALWKRPLASTLLRKDDSVRWRLGVEPGKRYDVKYFTVVATYYELV